MDEEYNFHDVRGSVHNNINLIEKNQQDATV